MIVFSETDFTGLKPQFLQIKYGNHLYFIKPLHMEISSRQICGRARKKVFEHVHGVYHIVLYLSGNASISYMGMPVKAEPGTLILTSPGESHCFFPITKGQLSYSEFTFLYVSNTANDLKISFLELLSLHSGLKLVGGNNIIKIDRINSVFLNDMIKSLARIREHNDNTCLYDFYRNIAEIFAFISRLLYKPENKSEQTLNERLAKAARYINAHFKEKITVEKLAAISSVSKGHFQRQFKKKYGDSPSHYTNKIRISAAKNLLRSTSLSCSDIASECGFANVFYFSKVFKKITGQKPLSFRKF